MLMGWIFGKLRGFFADKYVRSLVRGVLRIAGGVLVGYGFDNATVTALTIQAEPIITGAIMIIVGQLFSFADKAKQPSTPKVIR